MGDEPAKPTEREFLREFFDPALVESDHLPQALGKVQDPDQLENFFQHLENLPESLNLAGLRLQLRSLAFVSTIHSERLNRLAERVVGIIQETLPAESPFADAVIAAVEGIRPAHAAVLAPAVDSLFSRQEMGSPAWIRTVKLLGWFGPTSPQTVKTLAAELNGPNSDRQSHAAWALRRFGVQTPSARQTLLAALKDANSFVRILAVQSLGHLPAGTPEVAAGLLWALGDPRADVRWRVVEALGNHQDASPHIIEKLCDAFRDSDPYVRNRAANTLEKLKANTPATVQALLAAMRDAEMHVRIQAAWALERFGIELPEELTALLPESVPEETVELKSDLQTQPNTPPSITVANLLAGLGATTAYARQRSAQGLEKLIAEGVPEFAAQLETALAAETSLVRGLAVQFIGYYSLAETVLEKLRAMAQTDPDETIRQQAAEAARRYQNKAELF